MKTVLLSAAVSLFFSLFGTLPLLHGFNAPELIWVSMMGTLCSA